MVFYPIHTLYTIGFGGVFEWKDNARFVDYGLASSVKFKLSLLKLIYSVKLVVIPPPKLSNGQCNI